jgi:transcriptional regulator with XRE-family HTH domain
MTAVARLIEDLREHGGLKGSDVANIASVSPATVSRWESGKASPHPKTQLVISDLRYVVERLSDFTRQKKPGFGFIPNTDFWAARGRLI